MFKEPILNSLQELQENKLWAWHFFVRKSNKYILHHITSIEQESLLKSIIERGRMLQDSTMRIL
jgi:hypothetical protein